MGSDEDSAEWRRTRAHEEYMRPALLFLATDMSAEDWAADDSYLKTASWLASELPPNINVMTVDQARCDFNLLLPQQHLVHISCLSVNFLILYFCCSG